MRDARTRQHTAGQAVLLALSLALSPACGAEPEPTLSQRLHELDARRALLALSAPDRDAWRPLEAELETLIAQHPSDAAVRLARGDLRAQIGERELALADWREAARLDPQIAAPHARLAHAALGDGDPVSAFQHLREAVAREPRNARLHFDLANIGFMFRHQLLDAKHPTEESRLTEALGHFSAASNLAPENPEFAKAYAETFYSLPNPDWTAALQAWERVKGLASPADFALLNLARVHLRLRQPVAALKHLHEIQETSHERLKKLLMTQAEDLLQEETNTAAGRHPPTR